MIRRKAGNDFLLITQNDHAILSGKLAEHFGNARFARPQPRQETIDAASLHDCGWPIHDDAPTLNARGEPIDVFESPVALAVQVGRHRPSALKRRATMSGCW